MTSSRTLHPEDWISHYRIVGPLGAGGMGEVYLAQDRTLERSVALKVLSPELVRSEERVRRFVQEAKSASSLNHPNIVTIYEIGQDPVRPGGSEPDPVSSPVQFISMELISGKTLGAEIHDEKTDLRTLLGYLAQAAEGIAKAHSAGIVHRDLKPGNIMVSDDGFAKVLDFGLAKLTERRGPEAGQSSAPTEIADRTGEGVVLGTVGYMSPEQTLGKAVDHRSDLFSFGCILYEAATRTRPFAADSNVETMHKILRDKPAPIEEINPAAPAELRRLIRRCLAKSPDQRLQSMKDVAIELRDIVEEYDALSASATSASAPSGSSVAGRALAAGPSRRPWVVAGLAAVALVGIAGTGFGLFALLGRGRPSDSGEVKDGSVQITSVPGRGSANGAAISGDGRYLAHVSGPPGQWTLNVRQISTGSEVRILPPRSTSPWGLTFSPNGDYLFYLTEEEDAPNTGTLFQVPTLGGAPRKRTTDVWSTVSFAPDGKRVCFLRKDRKTGEGRIMIRDLDSGEERALATTKEPLQLVGAPAWSPDGSTIAAGIHSFEKGIHAQLVAIDVKDGRQTRIGTTGWEIRSIAWLPVGRGLVIAAFRWGASDSNQIWSVTYPEGKSRRITNDTNGYSVVSLSADGLTLASVRRARIANLWTVPAEGRARPRQITFNPSTENAVKSFSLAAEDRILFTARVEHGTHLFTVGTDGEGIRQLTSGTTEENAGRSLPGGGILVAEIGQDLVPHIGRVDADGGNLRPITRGTGEWLQDLAPDGRSLLYIPVDTPRELWSISVDGGEPKRIAVAFEGNAKFSPDGRQIAFLTPPELEGRSPRVALIVPASGGEPVATLRLPPDVSEFQWTPDGAGLSFVSDKGGVSNLLRQPIAGGDPRPITRFTEGEITGHEWLADGKRVLLVRVGGDVSNIWSVGADGGDPVAITDFVTGSVFDLRPSRDGKSVIFTYGSQVRDVVLLRSFR